MEKQILLDQLKDRIERALSLIIFYYPQIETKQIEKQSALDLLQLIEGIKCLLQVVIDIQYNDNIDAYKEEIYNIAKGEFNE